MNVNDITSQLGLPYHVSSKVKEDHKKIQASLSYCTIYVGTKKIWNGY